MMILEYLFPVFLPCWGVLKKTFPVNFNIVKDTNTLKNILEYPQHHNTV